MADLITRDDITIVVPTKNEATNISRFVASLPKHVRLIAVDSSHDDTPKLIERLRPDATVIRADANIPAARQIGVDATTTDWVLFTDADVVFQAGYFDRLEQLPLDDRTGGIVGIKWTTGGHKAYHRLFVTGQRILTRIGIPAASGSNMLVRRDIVREIGGFDPELDVNEDTELMFRVRKAGHRVRFGTGLAVESFDHRRLDRRVTKKLTHSLVRCAALWFGIGERLVRARNWGYWDQAPADGLPCAPSEVAASMTHVSTSTRSEQQVSARLVETRRERVRLPT